MTGIPSIEEVWTRIRSLEGQPFELRRGGTFEYEMFDGYLRPVGRVRHLSKTNFEKALLRVPLENTLSVADLQGPSYVFAVLMDRRVRRDDW